MASGLYLASNLHLVEYYCVYAFVYAVYSLFFKEFSDKWRGILTLLSVLAELVNNGKYHGPCDN